MTPDDLLVEVRTRDLVRVGQIAPKYLHLTATLRHNGTGEWSLTLPVADDLAEIIAALKEPGAGIVVTGPAGPLFSGPVATPKTTAAPQDPQGTVVVSGHTDDVLLWRRLAYPTPSTDDVTAQSDAYDVRSGAAETVMLAYVDANLGPSAPTSRRVNALTLAQDQGRGPAVVKSARFNVLGELLDEIATVAGLGFRVVQREDSLVFEVFHVEDRTAAIRLDVHNGTLSSQEVETSAPALTRAVVAGQGQGEERTFIERTTPEAVAAEAAWGPWGRSERFIDQRQTDDPDELRQAGDKALADAGAGAHAVKAVAANQTTMRYAIDWSLGDAVTVVIEGQETVATVTTASFVADSGGVYVGIGIGDVSGFDPSASLARRVDRTESRVAALERNAEGGGGPVVVDDLDASAIVSGVFDADRVPRLTNAHLPEPEPLETRNLNSVTDPGYYFQPLSANATEERNYPPGGAIAGFLEVLTGGSHVYQRYTTLGGSTSTARSETYVRGFYNNAWSDWRRLADGPTRRARGMVTVTASGSVNATRSVTFPAGLFQDTPRLTLTKQSDAAANFIPYATGITASGCTIGMYAGNGLAQSQSVPIYWVAEEG